jgi:hypothetical protein
VQTVLDLAIELDPSLIRHLTRHDPPSTIVRRHLICDCGNRDDMDSRIADDWIAPTCSGGCGETMRIDFVELLASHTVDVLTSEASPF